MSFLLPSADRHVAGLLSVQDHHSQSVRDGLADDVAGKNECRPTVTGQQHVPYKPSGRIATFLMVIVDGTFFPFSECFRVFSDLSLRMNP